MKARLAAIGWLLLAGRADGEPTPPAPPRVAIVPSLSVGIDAARIDALSQELAEALTGALEVDAIGGVEVRRKLPPGGLPAECVATPACAADVARRLDASQILFVVIVDTGGATQLDSTWVEPASGRAAPRPAIAIANAVDARPRFASAAHQLLPDAAVRAAPRPLAVTAAVPRHLTAPAIVAGAVGALGLGLGVGFGLHTRSRYHACDIPPGCTPDVRDGIRTTALVADAGFVLALAGTVAGGVLFALSGREAQLVVSAGGHGGAAIAVRGGF